MTGHKWAVIRDLGENFIHRYDIQCERCDLIDSSTDGVGPSHYYTRSLFIPLSCDLRVVRKVLEE